MTQRRPERRIRSGGKLFVAAAAAAASSFAASASVSTEADFQERRSAPDRAFFDLSDWTDDEKNELLDHALAIRDLSEDMNWSRPPAGDNSDDVTIRRRLLSEEEFLRAAEDEWDADFRRANGGRDRGSVVPKTSSGGVLRRTGRVYVGRARPKRNQGRNSDFRPRADFRCIDDDANLPCPPDDLGRQCDKYNDGTFKKCYQSCKPSFCCIHDSKSRTYSPSCAKTEPNCPSYFACYIIWWKLHDTIGPANYLRIAQNEAFYDADFNYILSDLEDDPEFFQQLFGHHFDGEAAPTDDVFEDPDNW